VITGLAAGLGGASLGPWAQAQDAETPVDIFPMMVQSKDGRGVRVRAFAPAESDRPLGILLFSHGALSTNLAYDRVLKPWARAGYLVLAPNHLDAGGMPPPDILPSARLWTTRVLDMLALMNSRSKVEAQAAKAGRRFDWSQLGATGHSFGGLTAQALVGAQATPVLLKAPDRRVKAVLALSPPGPGMGFIPPDSWKPIMAPMLVQTGTADIFAPNQDWRQHLASLESASSKVRWEVVGQDVNHLFGGLICYLDAKSGAQAPQLKIVTDVGTTFLDAYVKGDAAALAKLQAVADAQTYAPLVTVKAI
jgi:predicted dienelactone hydrolase